MSTIPSNIAHDRECDHCGYNLKGLQQGGKCPECGHPIRPQSSKTSGTIMDEAPTRFVKMLRLGFLLSSTGIILTVLSSFMPGPARVTIDIVASLLWICGIFFITVGYTCYDPYAQKAPAKPKAVNASKDASEGLL